MGFVADAVDSVVGAVGDVVEGVGDVIGDVVDGVADAVGGIVDAVGGFVENLMNDPLNAIAMVASIAFPEFAPLIQAANSAAHGGDIGDIALAAAAAWAGGEIGKYAGNAAQGSALEALAGSTEAATAATLAKDATWQLSQTIGRVASTGASSVTQQLINTGDVNLESALTAMATSGVMSGIDALAKQIPGFTDVLSPAAQKAVTAAMAAELTGKDPTAAAMQSALSAGLAATYDYVKNTDIFSGDVAETSDAQKAYDATTQQYQDTLQAYNDTRSAATELYGQLQTDSAAYQKLYDEAIAAAKAGQDTTAYLTQLNELKLDYLEKTQSYEDLVGQVNTYSGTLTTTAGTLADLRSDYITTVVQDSTPNFDATLFEAVLPQYMQEGMSAEESYLRAVESGNLTPDTYNAITALSSTTADDQALLEAINTMGTEDLTKVLQQQGMDNDQIINILGGMTTDGTPYEFGSAEQDAAMAAQQAAVDKAVAAAQAASATNPKLFSNLASALLAGQTQQKQAVQMQGMFTPAIAKATTGAARAAGTVAGAGVAPETPQANIKVGNVNPYADSVAGMTGTADIEQLQANQENTTPATADTAPNIYDYTPDTSPSEESLFMQNFMAGGVVPNNNFGYADQTLAMAGGGIAALQQQIPLGGGAPNNPVQLMAAGGLSSLGGYSDGGQLLKGPGTGLSDNIPATINGKQPARLADGEFVVSADVVSALGGGSTEAGAKVLYDMMERVRKAAHGTKQQIKKVNPAKVLPK